MQFKYEFTIVLVAHWLMIAIIQGKSIERCEFVRELKHFKPQIDYEELNGWTCIALYQSNFNTSLKNTDASGAIYHGIFQISDVYWCSSNSQVENACKINCDQLHDTFLKDDFDCLEQIYAEHSRIHGNGFSAWPIYQQYCSDGRDIIKDCLNEKKTSLTFENKSFQQKNKTKAIAEKKTHKIYERCELARELYFVHDLPYEQISTWVCIAKHESNFNTSAIGNMNGDGSLDHGLFQISDIYWCSPPGRGWVCGLSCAKLENNDITDDVACMKKIHQQHERFSGDGFNAWTVYQSRCKQNSDQFIAGCFDSDVSNEIILPMHKPGILAPTSIEKTAFKKKEVIGGAKVFSKCELAKELRYTHNLPKDQIHTWICIAQALSRLDTAVEAPKNADGSSSHGLFQISDEFWCDVNGIGKGCNINCASLKDGDITDDIQCVKMIFNDHQHLFGNGFQAWAPYEHYCKYERPESLSECFANEPSILVDVKPNHLFVSTKSPGIRSNSGKIYGRCELAMELRNVHNIPLDQIHIWVCIANHESRLDTAALGRFNADGSLDHGLFQISDIYWCSNEGNGKGCNAACADFRNADISDDVRCIKQIFDEHQRLFGNGFHAWTVYEGHCRHRTNQYISDCFPNEFYVKEPLSPPKSVVSIVSNAVGDQGRAYQRCELAKELRYRHNIQKDHISDWVCIALYSSNLATSARGQNSHGLFQINNEYWCSNNGVKGNQCNLDCNTLEDSDITDDLQCARLIYDTHQKLYGNGFTAWNVYEPYCRGRSTEIIAGCFDDIPITTNFVPSSPTFTLNVNYADNNQQTISSNVFDETTNKGKVYERCDLARELRFKYNLPLEQIHTWICIVQRESNFNTSAIGHMNGDGSLDHGLFQISDIYWCSNTGIGKACSAACASFRDSNIADDIQCIKRIFDEHQRLFGNGFHAWTTYEPYCSHTTYELTDACFAKNESQRNIQNLTAKILPTSVQFTTTPQKPSAIAATLTPFKYSTFAPFSQIKPTQPTTKFISKFVNYYATSTTQRSSFGTFSPLRSKPPATTTIQRTLATTVATTAFPLFGIQSTTPTPIASIGPKFNNKHTFAIIGNNFLTTTPNPDSIQTAGFSKTHLSPLPTIAPHTFFTTKATTTIQKPIFPSIQSTSLSKKILNPLPTPVPLTNFTMTTTPKLDLEFIQTAGHTKTILNPLIQTPAPQTSSTKFNLFDLYLGRLKTKAPERYSIPTLAPLPKQPVTKPYIVRTTSSFPSIASPSFHVNTYSLPDNYIKTKSSTESIQKAFQSEISRIAKSLGFRNTTYLPPSPILTSPKPRVWRYSFSGTKPTAQQC